LLRPKQVADLQFEEKGIREQIWGNKRENNAQGVYMRLVTL